MLRIKELNEYDQFAELREQWNDVLSKSKDNEVFLTWEWLSTWWRHYGKERELTILLAEDGEKIVGIAPLMRSIYNLFGLKLRKIQFIGAEHTDYRNFILTAKGSECSKLFIKYLSKLSWDCLEFGDIPETAESVAILRTMLGKTHMQNEMVVSNCFYIPLCVSWDVFLKARSESMRRNLRRRLRRLEEKHKVTLSRQDDIDSVQQGVEAFVDLHQREWSSKGFEGSFGVDPEFRHFILDVSKCFAEKKWLNLSFLTVDDVPISGGLNFEYNNIFYLYHCGYDPEYYRFGVGNLLISRLIQDSIQKGMAKFDFLAGTESYKRSWASLSRKNLEVGFIRNRLLPVLYDRITRSKEYDWIKSNNRGYLRKLKAIARTHCPSLYGALR
ncbi:GNAT family N-acetyltransferase [Candidatus Bathyarchaeota archaeon]|nr:GNAT family N-acetyltransferase [Candidatus Bathyarchaeota archaeon]